MNTTIIIAIIVIIILICCSSSIYFMTGNSDSKLKTLETTTPTPPAETKPTPPETKSTPPETKPVVPVAPDCPDVGWGIGKPGITIIEKECSLGPSYTGKLIKKCTAQGFWIDDNQCVSSGNADLIDISGDWKMMYGGNMGTAKITTIDNTNWNVTTSGNDTPGQQLPRGTTKIKYVANEGYYYNNNQAAKFTNSSYTKLDGGNYYFSK